ncbi:hypothetical protein [Microvirga pudoricolor]|uniref:hypothetical protein n=1 Tax=Microvirga pudoricolor TaxID=2778729 RepID=UPI00195271A8|nr:hypothetical protein [Microvirga pudoricolor]MBM6595650.1 hypothetical protein [Microvirga pudoricolor]
MVCSTDSFLTEDPASAQARRIDEYAAVISSIAENDRGIYDLPSDIRVAIETWTQEPERTS